MSNPTAKELLAQADQLMRRQRPSDDLPVLTELVRDADTPPLLEERLDIGEAILSFDDMALPEVEELDLNDAIALQPTFATTANASPASPIHINSMPVTAMTSAVTEAVSPHVPTTIAASLPTWTVPAIATSASAAELGSRIPLVAPPASFSDVSAPHSGGLYTREQFDAMLATKLEEVQHSVYSQVMQQLELHTTGRMRENLRAALEPTVELIVGDIITQIADETAIQMQAVVSNAVDAEVTRLREQITKRRESRG